MKTILSIGTHADDIEIGCGGTLALLNAEGAKTVHLIITSGEEGGTAIDGVPLAKVREAEAQTSAQILKSGDVLFFREPDGLIGFSKETKRRLVALIRELRPDVIFTHASSDDFPDHRVVHALTLQALTAARGPWYPGAPGAPHTASEVYGYEVWNPIPKFQCAVDITTTLEQKLTALRAHASQITTIDYARAVRGLAEYRGVTSLTGRYAEVFEVLKAPPANES